MRLVALANTRGAWMQPPEGGAATAAGVLSGAVVDFWGTWHEATELVPGDYGDAAAAAHDVHLECADDDATGFADRVTGALKLIEAGDATKIVVSRAVDFRTPTDPDPRTLFAAFRRRHPGATSYAVRDGAALWVGASPELVAGVNAGEFTAHPLAGSRPRTGDAGTDGRAETELLGSGKDAHEHTVVVDHIVERTKPLLVAQMVPPAAQITRTDTMIHLGTQLRGRVRDDVSSVDAARACHPTPAICGVPTAVAREFLRHHESHLRGVYGGLIGGTMGGTMGGSNSDGAWHLAIRCVQLLPGRVRVVVGAGVVAGSTVAGEMAETRAKAATALGALAECGFTGTL